MSTKGSTAIDFSEIAGAAGASADVAAAMGRSLVACFDNQNLSTTRYVSAIASTATEAMRIHRGCGVADLRSRVRRSETTAGSTSDPGARWRRTASTSFAPAASIPAEPTSIHCDSLRKYSKARVSAAESVRNATIRRCLDEARSISLPTWGEAIACSERTSTMTLDSLIARTISSA